MQGRITHELLTARVAGRQYCETPTAAWYANANTRVYSVCVRCCTSTIGIEVHGAGNYDNIINDTFAVVGEDLVDVFHIIIHS